MTIRRLYGIYNTFLRSPQGMSETLSSVHKLPTPICHGLVEIPSAALERAALNDMVSSDSNEPGVDFTPSMKHLSYGLALTVGSAIGSRAPSEDQCLRAFLVSNVAGLTAGARAWCKHSHRSEKLLDGEATATTEGWWGTPKGPVVVKNARALELFNKIMSTATWRNLHWLPHEVLVYEVRVTEGYGMRWSQDRSGGVDDRLWIFRGFVEPMMENGHELGWRH